MPNDNERQPQHETDSLSDDELEQVAGGVIGNCTPDGPWINKPGSPTPDDTGSGTVLPS